MRTMRPRPDRLQAYRDGAAVRGETERERDIVRHLPLVHSVVERLCAHLPPNIDREDLFHAGVIGLIDALNRFDASRDNAFSTYAVLRIRGQIIDELRDRDWVPRGVRERAKSYNQAVNELSQRHGRLPTDAELAAHLRIDPGELPELEREAQLAAQVSLDAPVGEDGTLGATVANTGADAEEPGRGLELEDRRAALLAVLKTLTEQERTVVKLYYFENLIMREIAALLGVTESRVCQIHARILAVLRQRLGASGPLL
jgi:RNA polymerase sigma factor for flagellar operon FliA